MATLFLLRSSRCRAAASSSLRSCFSSMVDRKVPPAQAQDHSIKKMLEEAKMISKDYVQRKGLRELSIGMDKFLHSMKKWVVEIKGIVPPKDAKEIEDGFQEVVDLRRILDLRKLLDGSNGMDNTMKTLIYSMRKCVGEIKDSLPRREGEEMEDAVRNLSKFTETAMKIGDGGERKKAMNGLTCIVKKFSCSVMKYAGELKDNVTPEESKEIDDVVQSVTKLVDLTKYIDGNKEKNVPHELWMYMDGFRDNVTTKDSKEIDLEARNEHISSVDKLLKSTRKYVDEFKDIVPPEDAKEIEALLQTLTTRVDGNEEEKTLNDMRSSLKEMIYSIEKSLGKDKETMAAEDAMEIENAIQGLRRAVDCNYTELGLAFEDAVAAADELDREWSAGMRALSKFHKLKSGDSNGSPLGVLGQDCPGLNSLFMKAKSYILAYQEKKAQNEMRCIMEEIKYSVAKSLDEFNDAKCFASNIFQNPRKAEITSEERIALNEMMNLMDTLIYEIANCSRKSSDKIDIEAAIKIESAFRNWKKGVARGDKIIGVAVGHLGKAAEKANTLVVAGMRGLTKLRTSGDYRETPRA